MTHGVLLHSWHWVRLCDISISRYRCDIKNISQVWYRKFCNIDMRYRYGIAISILRYRHGHFTAFTLKSLFYVETCCGTFRGAWETCAVIRRSARLLIDWRVWSLFKPLGSQTSLDAFRPSRPILCLLRCMFVFITVLDIFAQDSSACKRSIQLSNRLTLTIEQRKVSFENSPRRTNRSYESTIDIIL